MHEPKLIMITGATSETNNKARLMGANDDFAQ